MSASDKAPFYDGLTSLVRSFFHPRVIACALVFLGISLVWRVLEHTEFLRSELPIRSWVFLGDLIFVGVASLLVWILLGLLHYKNLGLVGYREGINSLSEGVYFVDPHDPDHPIISVNQAFTEITGYDESEILGRDCSFLHGERTSPEATETYHRAIENRESLQIEILNYRKDGTPFWCELTMNPLFDSKGNLFRYVGVQRDVTDQKELQQELENQVEFLDRVNQQLPGAVFRFQVDPKGRYSLAYASEGFEQLTGISPEVAMDDLDNLFEAVHPEDRERVLRSIDESVKTMSEWDQEYRYKLPDGTVKWVWGRSIPEQREDGSVEWSGILIDVTDRKRAEQEHKEMERRLRQVTENIQEVFWLITPDRAILYLSPAMEDIVGIPAEEIEQNPDRYTDMIHPEDRDRVLEAISERQHTGDYDEEYRIIRPDDEVRWVRDRAFPIRNDEGEIYRMAGITEDITEQKELQKRLEEALEEKTTLLQEVHHRVKNNMQVISSILGLEQRRGDRTSIDEILQDCRGRIQAMADVHETLYNSESLKDVELQDYLAGVSETALETMAPEDRDVELVFNGREESINVDLEKAVPIGLSVNELVSNAVQHATPENDELTLRLRMEAQDSRLRIHVRDSGPGLPSDLDPEHSDSLGFRLVRSLIKDQLDGEFDWENDPGAHFVLTLPIPSDSSL